MELSLKRIAINAALRAGEKILGIYNSRDIEVEVKEDNSPLTQADKAAHNAIAETLESTDLPILSEEGANIDYVQRKQWETFWLVDPLDGTKEFIKRNGEFTVNIALIEKQTPVLGVVYVPVTRTLYIGTMEEGAWKAENIPENTQFESSEIPGAQHLPLPHSLPLYTVVGSKSHMNKETENYCKELEKKHGMINFLSRGSSLKICMVAEGSAHEYPRFGPTMEWDTAAGHAIALASGCSVKQANGKPLTYNKEKLLNPYFIVKRSF